MRVTKRIALGLLGTAALCAGAVAVSARKPTPKAGAHSFSVLYEWRTGTVAPPYQSNYTISLGPGARGRMVMRPGRTSSGPNSEPVWTESFPFSAAARDRLRQTMHAHGVFSNSWQEASGSNRPIGGGSENLEVRSGGRKFSIPAFLDTPQAQADADAVYAAINALVPTAARARLEAKRQKYQDQALKAQG